MIWVNPFAVQRRRVAGSATNDLVRLGTRSLRMVGIQQVKRLVRPHLSQMAASRWPKPKPRKDFWRVGTITIND